MTGPREWRHAEDCALELFGSSFYECTCGLSAVRDAIAAGHRVVIGPDGVEGRVQPAGESLTEAQANAGPYLLHRIVPLEEP